MNLLAKLRIDGFLLGLFAAMAVGVLLPARGEAGHAVETATKVAVWIAEPGIYPYPPRDLEETFVVLEGEAMCSLGGAAPQKIGPGSIVRVPKGVAPWLHVLTPFRKLATVVPKP